MILGLLSFNLTSIKGMVKEDFVSCFDQAYIVMHQALNAGYSELDATWFMNVSYALCSGYSMDDIN